MTRRLSNFVIARPAWIVAACLLVTAFAVTRIVDIHTGELRLKIDPSTDRLLPASSAERQFYDRVKHIFGSDDTVIVAVHGEPIFSQQHIDRIQRLTNEFETLPGVYSVLSLANAPNARAEGIDIDVDSFANQFRDNPAAGKQLLADALANPLYRNRLVTEDGQLSTLVIVFRDLESRAFIEQDLLGRIRAINTAATSSGVDIWTTGSQVIKAETAHAMNHGLQRVLPMLLVFMGLFLLVAFHSLRGLLLPSMTIGMALLWTLALVDLLNLPLNLVTSLMPPILVTLGLAYTMHVMSEYYAMVDKHADGDTLPKKATRAKRLRSMLDVVGLPMVVTCATTSAGFLALLLNPLAAIREFAILSAAGIAFTGILCLTFFPAVLQLIGSRDLGKPPFVKTFKSIASWLATKVIRHRKKVLAVGAVVMIVSLFGAGQISLGTNYIRDFSPESQVRQDYEAISEKLGGINQLSIVLDSHFNDTFVDGEILTSLEQLQSWLNEQPEVSATISLLDHIRLINQTLNEGDPDYFVVPDNKTTIKQLLVFGGGEEIEGIVDSRFRMTRIDVQINIDNTARVSDFVERLETRLAGLPEPLIATVTGNTVLLTQAIDQIAEGQGASIGIALFVVLLILAGLFTSLRTGVVALIPNLIPVTVYFGALGFLDIPLNATTSLIATVVLGIAVDDTIHYLARFNVDAREQASEQKATYTALNTVLRPITYTTVALIAGFLVLTAGELANQVQFGMLAAFTMFIAWVTDVTFTPALASSVRIVTLWDVLRLDLGEGAQRSIPLFNGMSLRQARTFALMSELKSHESGRRIITEGAEAHSIYVVIDGELTAWTEHDGQRVDLSTMRRGAVMGEVGHFGSRRTANVDADTDCRLLRFDSNDLERLRRRFPGVAALAYRNLNRIQAERLARATKQMK